MGHRCKYADLKGTELAIVCKEIAIKRGLGASAYKDIILWVDKASIPQKTNLVSKCISMLEDFVERSDGLLVILTWGYFKRLWCVYEWCCFLHRFNPLKVSLCVNAFLRPSTLALYVDSIENFRVANAGCAVETDRVILKDKIIQYYKSISHFEMFLKATATALMARVGILRAGFKPYTYDVEYMPWVDLAGRLRMNELKGVLLTARPEEWASNAKQASASATTRISIGVGSRAWVEQFQASIDEWFEEKVTPILDVIKGDCIRVRA